jgi:hypothetical protein
MIILLLCGLCTNVLILVEINETAFNVITRLVWIINTLVSNLTSILALLFCVTRNRNHIRNILSVLSRVDNNLFRNDSKQDAYSKQRSHVKMQLWIALIIFGIVVISCMFSYSEYSWVMYITTASQILSDIINTTMLFQYVNIVLMIKQRYQIVEHMLSEAAITDYGNSSTRTDKEHFRNSRNINSNRTFTITTRNWKSGTNSNNIYTYTIRNLRFICSEL